MLRLTFKNKSAKHFTTRNLHLTPLASNTVDSDGQSSPDSRMTPQNERFMIRSESMPIEMFEQHTPFMSKVVSPSKSLR